MDDSNESRIGSNVLEKSWKKGHLRLDQGTVHFGVEKITNINKKRAELLAAPKYILSEDMMEFNTTVKH